MQNEPIQVTAPEQPDPNASAAAPTTAITWQAELAGILARAAKLAADHGVELDAFMKGAWQSYIDARPGYREHLEDLQLREQLAELRSQGRLEVA